MFFEVPLVNMMSIAGVHVGLTPTQRSLNNTHVDVGLKTLFKSITMLRGTKNIPQNIPQYSLFQSECGNIMKYCQSHKTLLWI